MQKLDDVGFEELFEDSEESVLPPENIVVLNELRSAADLNRLMAGDESIELGPDFQREEVWSDAARARFVDSLSKEFPIPSMCFALDPKTQKYIVIDGRQRMSTIMKFLSRNNWTIPKLGDIDARISGNNVEDIKSNYPEIYRKIENISLPVTILRYDPSRQDNMEYIYTIFQRLNSLGERLNNQEIRNAIFQGPFNTFIKTNARKGMWEILNKSKSGSVSPRMVGEERLLRFFAFYDNLSVYTGKLNSFLNDYMTENRLQADNRERQMVLDGVLGILEKIDYRKINKSNALRDAFLYGVSKNLSNLESMTGEEIEALLQKMEDDEHFSVSELSGSIMAKKKVIDRLSVATTIFSSRD